MIDYFLIWIILFAGLGALTAYSAVCTPKSPLWKRMIHRALWPVVVWFALIWLPHGLALGQKALAAELQGASCLVSKTFWSNLLNAASDHPFGRPSYGYPIIGDEPYIWSYRKGRFVAFESRLAPQAGERPLETYQGREPTLDDQTPQFPCKL